MSLARGMVSPTRCEPGQAPRASVQPARDLSADVLGDDPRRDVAGARRSFRARYRDRALEALPESLERVPSGYERLTQRNDKQPPVRRLARDRQGRGCCRAIRWLRSVMLQFWSLILSATRPSACVQGEVTGCPPRGLAPYAAKQTARLRYLLVGLSWSQMARSRARGVTWRSAAASTMS